MMTVFCEGRDYGYELAGVAMLFFRGEKVIPAKEGEEPLDNFILAETNLRPGTGLPVADRGTGEPDLGGQ